tara:strand:- start:87 stop:425 length:339 start_codon:yes stop_codon:yes gene_type:complete
MRAANCTGSQRFDPVRCLLLYALPDYLFPSAYPVTKLPSRIMELGEQLARQALAQDYGHTLIYFRTLNQPSKVRHGTSQIAYNQCGVRLPTRDGGTPKRFELEQIRPVILLM